MPRESKAELYAAIRRDSREGLSFREIARKHRVGNHTISAALKSAWPQPRKPYPKRSSKLEPFKPAIDVMLRNDLDAPKKQRHTVTRIYARLIEEHAMTGVSYQTVREYVAERKPQIWAAAGRGPAKVFIPQTHRPGEEAEVDFGEVAIRLRGEPATINLFAFRMSFSGKAVHRPIDGTNGVSYHGCQRGRETFDPTTRIDDGAVHATARNGVRLHGPGSSPDRRGPRHRQYDLALGGD